MALEETPSLFAASFGVNPPLLRSVSRSREIARSSQTTEVMVEDGLNCEVPEGTIVGENPVGTGVSTAVGSVGTSGDIKADMVEGIITDDGPSCQASVASLI